MFATFIFQKENLRRIQVRARIESMLEDFLASDGSCQDVNIGKYLPLDLLGKDCFLVFYTTRVFLEKPRGPESFLLKSCISLTFRTTTKMKSVGLFTTLQL